MATPPESTLDDAKASMQSRCTCDAVGHVDGRGIRLHIIRSRSPCGLRTAAVHLTRGPKPAEAENVFVAKQQRYNDSALNPCLQAHDGQLLRMH